jgi:hypothetical protein
MGIAADIARFPSLGTKGPSIDPVTAANLELQAQRQLQQFQLESQRVAIEAERSRAASSAQLIDVVTSGNGVPSEPPGEVDFRGIVDQFSQALTPSPSVGFAEAGQAPGPGPAGPGGLFADPMTLLLIAGAGVLLLVALRRK